MEQLTLDIPAATRTQFLVATDRPLAWPAEHVAAHFREFPAAPADLALTTAARNLLSSPALTIESFPASRSTWREELPDIASPAPSLHTRLLGAPYHHVVEVVAPPVEQPSAAQAARFIARILASRCAGVLADLAAHTVLRTSTAPAERPEWTLADEWVTVFVTRDEQAGASLRAETWGLHRFGLPELCTQGFGFDVQLTAVNLVRGLATWLIHDLWEHLAGPEPDLTWTIPVQKQLEISWVYRYYRKQPPRSNERRRPSALTVLLEPMVSSPTADLQILPPAFMRPATDRWWRNYAALAIPDLIH